MDLIPVNLKHSYSREGEKRQGVLRPPLATQNKRGIETERERNWGSQVCGQTRAPSIGALHFTQSKIAVAGAQLDVNGRHFHGVHEYINPYHHRSLSAIAWSELTGQADRMFSQAHSPNCFSIVLFRRLIRPTFYPPSWNHSSASSVIWLLAS